MSVSLVNHTITQGDLGENIESFETWWLHPFKGFFQDLGEAVKACTEVDMTPEQLLRPVTVAKGKTLWEPILR